MAIEKKIISKTFWLVVAALLVPLSAWATKTNSVAFEERVVVGDQSLEIKGVGILRYMLFIEAYAGALYTLPGLDPRAVLSDTPKRLEIEYFHPLKGKAPDQDLPPPQ